MECRLCGSKKSKVVRKFLRHNIKRNVLRCIKCGFVFLENIKVEKRNFYKKKEYRLKYGPILNKINTPQEIFDIYYPVQKPIVDEIKHILKPNTKILDIGCSTGHFLHSLKSKVGKRVGLELNQEHASFIRKNLKFKVYSEPLETVSIKEAPFDLITCLQILEHLENPLKFLKNVANILKPNGYLYMELPNVNESLLSCYKIKNYEDFYYREPHLSYFSVKTLKILLDKAGFVGKIKTVQRYNILNHINWILNEKPQPDCSIGYGEAFLVKANDVNLKIKNDLNKFIKKVDENYKNLLSKYDLGESLTFIGKKI